MSAKRLITICLLFVVWPAWAALNIQQWTTPSGAGVYFVENRDLPMLDISVAFPAGSARDSKARSGLAGMTLGMMQKGAGEWSEQQIAERLADVGATLSGQFDQDRAGFSLRTLSSPRERDRALAILRTVLSQPRFPAEVLAREKARAIASIKEAETQPDYLGDKAFMAAIYGQHPYGLPGGGETASLAKLQRHDVVGFYRQHYRARAMTLAIMGDISRAEAEVLARNLSGELPPGEAPLALPAVQGVAQGSVQVVPHHATQSHLFIGLPGMTRDDPDYFPLLVGNYVLGGGGFDSRLLIEVRQKRGLAYSAFSYFMPLQQRGPFQIGLQTKRETTDEAVKVVQDTLDRFLAEGPSDTELAQAKNNLIGSFPLRLDSNRKILEYLSLIGFYRLPLDWLDTYTRKVEAVSKDEIMRAFRARLRPEALSTVIVGGQVGQAGK